MKIKESKGLDAHEVTDWASSNLKEKVKHHLESSVKAWHDWNEDLPKRVEVICNEVKRNRGQFLTVSRWLIIPPESGLMVKNVILMLVFLSITANNIYQ